MNGNGQQRTEMTEIPTLRSTKLDHFPWSEPCCRRFSVLHQAAGPSAAASPPPRPAVSGLRSRYPEFQPRKKGLRGLIAVDWVTAPPVPNDRREWGVRISGTAPSRTQAGRIAPGRIHSELDRGIYDAAVKGPLRRLRPPLTAASPPPRPAVSQIVMNRPRTAPWGHGLRGCAIPG